MSYAHTLRMLAMYSACASARLRERCIVPIDVPCMLHLYVHVWVRHNDEEAMAKNINLVTSIQPKVTALKLSTGQYTEIGKETCEEMMAKHFPTHTPKTNPEYNHTKVTTTEITKPDYKPWITQSHVVVFLKFL